jgi:hypothetical protein
LGLDNHERIFGRGWATDQHVALVPNVVTTGQLQELLAVQVRIEAKVKGLQSLGGVDGGAAQAQDELFRATAVNLIFKQAGKKLDIRPTPINRLARPKGTRHFQCLQNAGKPQLFEIGGKLMH